jgi:hypothetical protein
MSRHTKGAWVFHRTPYRISVETGEEILSEQYLSDCGETQEDDDRAIANARLIAAAPDLLEALDYALSALAHCRADKGYGSMQSRAANLAANAIAKARGEA